MGGNTDKYQQHSKEGYQINLLTLKKEIALFTPIAYSYPHKTLNGELIQLSRTLFYFKLSFTSKQLIATI